MHLQRLQEQLANYCLGARRKKELERMIQLLELMIGLIPFWPNFSEQTARILAAAELFWFEKARIG